MAAPKGHTLATALPVLMLKSGMQFIHDACRLKDGDRCHAPYMS